MGHPWFEQHSYVCVKGELPRSCAFRLYIFFVFSLAYSLFPISGTSEYAAKTLGSWTCNVKCRKALCARSRELIPVLRVAMNRKDLVEVVRVRTCESAARIIGETMEIGEEKLALLLLQDFAMQQHTDAPSLLQALICGNKEDSKNISTCLTLLAVFLQNLKQPKLCILLLNEGSTWRTILSTLRSKELLEASAKLIISTSRK